MSQTHHAHPGIGNECLKLSYVIGAFIAGALISGVAVWHGIFQH